jgi:tetraacyldisaccharide 4'-kinase
MFKHIKTPEFWHSKNIISGLLVPLSVIYFLTKRILYLFHKKGEVSFNIKTICVGNIIAGGSGKTPTTLKLYSILKNAYPEKKLCILSKGYKGILKGPIQVKADKNNAFEVGDEPYMMAEKGNNVVISSDRVKGIKFCEELGYDIVIIDDGLHDHRVNYDIALIIVDGKYGNGNGLIIPSGPLRDRIDYAAEKADAILVIGEDEKNICDKINKKLGKKLPVFDCFINPLKLPAKEDLFVAFAALGRPQKFFDYLKDDLKLSIVRQVSFADHFGYAKQDEEELLEIAKQEKAKLITTEKDYVKLSSEMQNKVETLNIEINFEDVEKIRKYLKEKLNLG